MTSTRTTAISPSTTVVSPHLTLQQSFRGEDGEQQQQLSHPSQQPLRPRYDVSTYTGRLWKFIDLTSPQHLFCGDGQIKGCQNTLQLTANGISTGASHNDILKCQSMVEACVHPTTHEIIPFYGRMASFTPVNIPICAGMLFAPPTLPHLIGWQWLNQTYNAIFNHCNAAKAGTTTDESSKQLTFLQQYGDIVKGYTGAIIVSVGLSVGLTQGLKRAKLSPSVKSCLQAVVPYTAVASAAMANVGLMRINELSTGLPVNTPEGVYVGHSKIAAKKALTETMISRAVLSIPILLLPPPLIALALRWNVLRSNRFLKAATELSFLTLGIAVGLPMAIALYPQDTKLPLSEIEPELRAKAEEIRKVINVGSSTKEEDEPHIVFNKGV